jgi:Amt family ammonium transporter
MSVLAAATAKIDTGDTAWMLVATALVLMMTPALGLFYAGLVRAKNTLNTFMMCVGALGVVAIVWALVGYSLAFDGGGSILGGLGNAFMNGVDFVPREGQTIPHLVFFAFEATFCIITAALIAGAVVERMRYGTFLVFMAIWSIAVYAVLAHWVWGGGWLADNGVLDFAGGVPVEMASGFSAFAAAMVVGPCKDYGRAALLPHNAVYVLLGAGLLWFGWFGFNGGSGLNAGQNGVLAFTNTLLAPAATLVVWMLLDLWRNKQVTAIGAATAIVVGCVAITPAGGYISPMWAIALGAIGAVPSYFVIAYRPRTRLDETLDVLAAHGLAGLTGIVTIGLVAQVGWNGLSDGLLYGDAGQFGWQLIAALVAPTYAFAMTFGLLKALGAVMPLRVSEAAESTGLDIQQHGEEAYSSAEGAILVVPPEPGGDLGFEPAPVPVRA